MFCVECGRETETGPLCDSCRAIRRKIPTLPEYLDLVECGSCGAFLLAGRWVEIPIEDVIKATLQNYCARVCNLESLRLSELEGRDERVNSIQVYLTSREGTEIHTDKYDLTVRIHDGTCNVCGRLSGNYFEAIIQLRAAGRQPSAGEISKARELVESCVASISARDRGIFMSRAEEVKGGTDFYLSSNQAGQVIARELAEALGARYSASSELYGQKDGRELYRMTFLVRLPPYWPGAFIVHDGRIARIVSIVSKRTVLRYLDTWEELPCASKDLELVRLLGGDEMTLEGVVLAETEREVQLLDPETNAVLDVVKPRGWRRRGETARFVKYDDAAYMV